MGTRADFFIGIGPTAEWIGSTSFDGDPRSWGAGPLMATAEAEFRAAVELMLSDPRSLTTRPEEGWPWPWPDFRTSDYGYAWDPERGAVASSGREWVTAQQLRDGPDCIYEGPRLLDTEVMDMSKHKKADVMAKSGLLIRARSHEHRGHQEEGPRTQERRIQMIRKLVSVQTIDSIAPIPGADNIDQARVLGWTVVVKKGEFAPGDPCVFFEIDSVLPDGPAWSEFMRTKKFRIKTIRLRGVLSQGLALPLSIFDGRAVDPDALGVTKYEPVLPDSQDIAGPFPTQVPKTDEMRLQSVLGVLEELRGTDFYVTTKLDGTSATYMRLEGEDRLLVCSRNWEVKRGENPVWRMAAKYALEERLPVDFAIQGEICGPGIQKNRLGLAEADLFVFNVYDVRRGAYLGFRDFLAFCQKQGLTPVPILTFASGPAADAMTMDAWIDAARGTYAADGFRGSTSRREGIVVRPTVEKRSEVLGGRLSFKVINNDFLLKDED